MERGADQHVFLLGDRAHCAFAHGSSTSRRGEGCCRDDSGQRVCGTKAPSPRQPSPRAGRHSQPEPPESLVTGRPTFARPRRKDASRRKSAGACGERPSGPLRRARVARNPNPREHERIPAGAWTPRPARAQRAAACAPASRVRASASQATRGLRQGCSPRAARAASRTGESPSGGGEGALGRVRGSSGIAARHERQPIAPGNHRGAAAPGTPAPPALTRGGRGPLPRSQWGPSWAALRPERRRHRARWALATTRRKLGSRAGGCPRPLPHSLGLPLPGPLGASRRQPRPRRERKSRSRASPSADWPAPARHARSPPHRGEGGSRERSSRRLATLAGVSAGAAAAAC